MQTDPVQCCRSLWSSNASTAERSKLRPMKHKWKSLRMEEKNMKKDPAYCLYLRYIRVYDLEIRLGQYI